MANPVSDSLARLKRTVDALPRFRWGTASAAGVVIDGGTDPIPCSFLCDAQTGDRVMVMMLGSKAIAIASNHRRASMTAYGVSAAVDISTNKAWYSPNLTSAYDNGQGRMSLSGGGIKVNQAGWYLLSGTLYLGAMANQHHYISSYVINGSADERTSGRRYFSPPSNIEVEPMATAMLHLNAGDVVNLGVQDYTGAEGQIRADTYTHLTIVEV